MKHDIYIAAALVWVLIMGSLWRDIQRNYAFIEKSRAERRERRELVERYISFDRYGRRVSTYGYR